VLACVTIAYVSDVFIVLGPGVRTYEATLRLQWVGIAFIPAAMFHLSDALLATTGLPSRGRRRRVARILYLISGVFLIAAAFSDALVSPVRSGSVVSLQAEPIFPVYLAFFLIAIGVAFLNVQRARTRCVSRSTQRRMTYLQIAFLTPPLGIFPYSVLLGPGEEFSLSALVLVNTANIVVILMLLFLAYPLSFFGSRTPDRVVKAELLRLFLLGPATALLALAIIVYMPQATRVLSLPGETFMPFAVVAVVLLWQWLVDLALPWLKKRLIYAAEDDEQLEKLESLSERLLTRSDLNQLIEAILEASCDYLQVNTAFVATFNGQETEVIKAIGPDPITSDQLREEASGLRQLILDRQQQNQTSVSAWGAFWIVPLVSERHHQSEGPPATIGILGIEMRTNDSELSADEETMLLTFVRRSAQTLDDMLLQTEIYAALEGLLPQISMTRSRASAVEFRPGYEMVTANGLPDQEQLVEQVRAALRHYWGGPGLTRSRLLELAVVHSALADNDDDPGRALRAILLTAIENLRPEGERKMTSPEWTLYNILHLRFVEKKKVREVAIRLAMSEADLFRKQRFAIETLTETLMKMDQEQLTKTENRQD
jgi:hypothetical protein